MTNPAVLVEVTSKSTEDYDRGDKLSHYKQLPALEVVVFVSHRQRRVTTVRRTESGWVEADYRAGEHVPLLRAEQGFMVDELYLGIELDPE